MGNGYFMFRQIAATNITACMMLIAIYYVHQMEALQGMEMDYALIFTMLLFSKSRYG